MFRGKSLYSKFLLAVPAIAVSLPALAVDEIIVFSMFLMDQNQPET